MARNFKPGPFGGRFGHRAYNLKETCSDGVRVEPPPLGRGVSARSKVYKLFKGFLKFIRKTLGF